MESLPSFATASGAERDEEDPKPLLSLLSSVPTKQLLSPNSAAAASQQQQTSRHATRMTSVVEPLLARGGTIGSMGPSTPLLGRGASKGSMGPSTPLGTVSSTAFVHVNQVAVTLDGLNGTIHAMIDELNDLLMMAFATKASRNEGVSAEEHNTAVTRGQDGGGVDSPTLAGIAAPASLMALGSNNHDDIERNVNVLLGMAEEPASPPQSSSCVSCLRCDALDAQLRTMQDRIAHHTAAIEASLAAHSQAVSSSVLHMAAMSSSRSSSILTTVSSQPILSESNHLGFIPPMPSAAPLHQRTISPRYAMAPLRGSFYFQRDSDVGLDPNMTSVYSTEEVAAASQRSCELEEMTPIAGLRQQQEGGGSSCGIYAPAAPPGTAPSPHRHRHRRQQQSLSPRNGSNNNNSTQGGSNPQLVAKEDIQLPFHASGSHHHHHHRSTMPQRSSAYSAEEGNGSGGRDNGPLGGRPVAAHQLAIKVVNDSVVIPFLVHRSASLSAGDSPAAENPDDDDSAASSLVGTTTTACGGRRSIDAILLTAAPPPGGLSVPPIMGGPSSPLTSSCDTDAAQQPTQQHAPVVAEQEHRGGRSSTNSCHSSDKEGGGAVVRSLAACAPPRAGNHNDAGAEVAPSPRRLSRSLTRHPTVPSQCSTTGVVSRGSVDGARASDDDDVAMAEGEGAAAAAPRRYDAPRIGASFLHQVPPSSLPWWSTSASPSAATTSVSFPSTQEPHRTPAPDTALSSSARPSMFVATALSPMEQSSSNGGSGAVVAEHNPHNSTRSNSNNDGGIGRNTVARRSVYAGIQLRNTFKLP